MAFQFYTVVVSRGISDICLLPQKVPRVNFDNIIHHIIANAIMPNNTLKETVVPSSIVLLVRISLCYMQ